MATARAEEIRAEETDSLTSADSLTSLEERIVRAVQLVGQLRQENDALKGQIEETLAEKQAAVHKISELETQYLQLSEELDGLRGERKQVRNRIEKLLGQMDLLSAT